VGAVTPPLIADTGMESITQFIFLGPLQKFGVRQANFSALMLYINQQSEANHFFSIVT
jgi:hypothetical protein